MSSSFGLYSAWKKCKYFKNEAWSIFQAIGAWKEESSKFQKCSYDENVSVLPD